MTSQRVGISYRRFSRASARMQVMVVLFALAPICASSIYDAAEPNVVIQWNQGALSGCAQQHDGAADGGSRPCDCTHLYLRCLGCLRQQSSRLTVRRQAEAAKARTHHCKQEQSRQFRSEERRVG